MILVKNQDINVSATMKKMAVSDTCTLNAIYSTAARCSACRLRKDNKEFSVVKDGARITITRIK